MSGVHLGVVVVKVEPCVDIPGKAGEHQNFCGKPRERPLPHGTRSLDDYVGEIVLGISAAFGLDDARFVPYQKGVRQQPRSTGWMIFSTYTAQMMTRRCPYQYIPSAHAEKSSTLFELWARQGSTCKARAHAIAAQMCVAGHAYKRHRDCPHRALSAAWNTLLNPFGKLWF